MYIGEVIRRAQSYCPSEYDINEMYSWCDEVSSMLAIEDRNVFVKETFTPTSDGSILLPGDVKFENVYSVTVDGKELRKEDLRNIENKKFSRYPVEVVYLKPYSPIRAVSYKGDITVDKESSLIILDSNIFRAGDTLDITIGDETVQVQVFEINFNDGMCEMCVTTGKLDGLPEMGFAQIERVVTDKTVCDAPYDSMYIDYIIAKICIYQRDFNTYNQFMASFNSRLNAYKKWITNQLPQAGGRLKNWW